MASPLLLFFLSVASMITPVATSDRGMSHFETARNYPMPRTWTSSVPGAYFDRLYQIWLENIDYSDGANNTDLSQPNYCAAVSGDSYGMNNDNSHHIPSNVSTIVDLLNTKGISWAEYQQDIPSVGFQGTSFPNQQTHAVAYVRKHNPLISFDSVTKNKTALEFIKGFPSFQDDLERENLPQWAFLTPNMTNDGHDTSLAYGANWVRGFISGLMHNEYFWNNTLILLTFDETKTYSAPNRVFSILMGGAIAKDQVGNSDHTVYTHYSTISTVSANWGLPSLGRWDCGANIFEPVAKEIGYTNWMVDTKNLYLNASLPGPLEGLSSSKYRLSWPVPSTNDSCSAGNGILQSVIDIYKGLDPTYNYTAPFPYDTLADLDLGVAFSRNSTVFVSGVNTTGSIGHTSSRISSHSSNATSKGRVSAKNKTGSAFSVPLGIALCTLLVTHPWAILN